MDNIELKEIMVHYETKYAGSHIDEIIKELLFSANATGIACFITFNGTPIVAKPGDDEETIHERWEQER